MRENLQGRFCFRKIAAATQEFFRKAGEKFYHRRAKTGTLRHLVVRKARFTGEILINLVTNSGFTSEPRAFANELRKLRLNGEIAGILHTINDSVADAVRCDRLDILYGRDFFIEQLLGLLFRISAFSFFQTNSAQAERMYLTVREFAGDLRNKSVLDLYCGTGTIAQVLCSSALDVGSKSDVVYGEITAGEIIEVTGKITGIEKVAEAVESARSNAQLNGLNCEFIVGDVLKTIDNISYQPNLIVLDPPREGVHPKAMRKILNMQAEKIIYISCNPATMARDIAFFVNNGYNLNCT